jgi:hypothetical protein
MSISTVSGPHAVPRAREKKVLDGGKAKSVKADEKKIFE